MELFEHHLIQFQLLEIGPYQKLKSKLNLLSGFVLNMLSLFIISRIVLRHKLIHMCRKLFPGNVVHIEATKAAFETLKSCMIYAPVL